MKHQDRKDSSAFKTVVLSIVIGAVIGSVIGLLGLLGVIPGDKLEVTTAITIKVCVGFIVLIIDLLLAYALCQPLIRDYIDKHGVRTSGVIEYVREIPRPDQLGEDEWVRKCLFSFTVKYRAGSKEYTKEFPPTPLTSKRELYPLSFEEGKEIPIEYLKRAPSFALIDIEVLKEAWRNENKKSRIHFIMIPIIITAAYIITIVMI